MLREWNLSKAKGFKYVMLFVALAGALHYATLHYSLITDPLPLTLREPAPILISEAYAEQLGDGFALPYSVEQYPQATSVYGPIYTLLTGVIQLGFDVDPYVLHRWTNALILLCASILCGVLVKNKGAGYSCSLLVGVWLYLHYILDSTVAAGPGALGVLFYLLGIAAMVILGAGRRGLALAIAAGFLGLMTKPYVSLIIPAALTYVYLFHSPRRALCAAGITAVATCVLFYFSSIFMPTYYHSVYEIHSAFASRHLQTFVGQTLLFSKLNFGLLIVFLLVFPLSFRICSKGGVKDLWGTQPLIDPDVGFDRFLALIAAAALVLLLGWHGGAFLTYYDHLLLPPLLIASFRYLTGIKKRHYILLGILIINMIFLLSIRPMLRAEDKAFTLVVMHMISKSALVDPVLDTAARLYRRVEVIDNGQTEYLVKYDEHFGGAYSDRSKEWVESLESDIESGAYDGLYLSPAYFRELLLDEGVPSDLLFRNYKIENKIYLPIYYTSFRKISNYGKGRAEIFYFEKRDTPINEDDLSDTIK